MPIFLVVLPSGFEWLLVLIALAIVVLPVFLFIRTLEDTLKQIPPARRTLRPSAVWWLLVPGLGLLWAFPMTARFSTSIEAESAARGRPQSAAGLRFSGIAAAMLTLAYVLPLERLSIWSAPHAGSLVEAITSLGGLLCWILFWIGAAKWQRELKDASASRN